GRPRDRDAPADCAVRRMPLRPETGHHRHGTDPCGFGGRKEDGMLRNRRRDDDAGPAAAGGDHRYRMVEKLVAFGDDFWIENGQGQRIFKVDGKALRLRDTLVFRDAHGNEVCKIQERVARIRDTMEVEGPNGQRLAVVKKAMITPLRDRFVVNVADGPDLEVQGNILDHEYRIGHV